MRSDLTAGSPLWQAIFVLFAVVLIVFEIVRGWRLGLLRQLMRVVAIAAAYAAAIFGGHMLVPLVRPAVKMPDIVISALAGAILAFLVYSIIASLGTILFKRTGQQESGAVRLIYGLSGAFVGLFFGAFFICLVLVGIRSIGSIADAQVRGQPKLNSVRNAPRVTPEEPNSVTTLLARLKNSMELGAVGNAVKRTDVVPAGVYRTLTDVGTVFSNPETAQRFLAFPGVQELSEHPKIVALRNDPEIADMISQGRLIELLRDPRIIDALNDPTLTDQVKKFDLQRALDYSSRRAAVPR